MTWFKVSDEFAFHPKVVAAGTAITTWIRSASWSAQQLTDGFIPTHMFPAIGPKKDASRLVSVGLWDVEDGGYRFHDWDDYQPSRAQVEDKRSKRQEAGRKGGIQSGQSRSASKREANASPNGSRSVGTRANPRPVPVPKEPSYSPESESESSLTRGPTSPAGRIVAAWTEGCKAAGISPIADQSTTVGKLARELLEQGNDIGLVITAAEIAAAKGSPWIADSLGPAVAKQREHAASVVSANDPVWGATLGSTA